MHPGAEGAVHASLSCKAHGFGATQARSQLLQAASSGFCLKQLCTLATVSLRQRRDLCQPSPRHVTPESVLTGTLEGAASHPCEPHPLWQLGAPTQLCRLSHVQGTSSSLLQRVTSDQWHL